MSLKQKIFSVFTLALTLVALTTFVSAQDASATQPDSASKQEKHRHGKFGKERGFGRENHGGAHGDKMMMRGLHQLDLTESQKTQIHSLMESNRVVNQTAFEEVRALKMKKRGGETLTADEQARVEILKAQLKSSAEQTRSSIQAILTADQRARLEQMKAERKSKMQERRQMRQNRQTSPNQTDNR